MRALPWTHDRDVMTNTNNCDDRPDDDVPYIHTIPCVHRRGAQKDRELVPRYLEYVPT